VNNETTFRRAIAGLARGSARGLGPSESLVRGTACSWRFGYPTPEIGKLCPELCFRGESVSICGDWAWHLTCITLTWCLPFHGAFSPEPYSPLAFQSEKMAQFYNEKTWSLAGEVFLGGSFLARWSSYRERLGSMDWLHSGTIFSGRPESNIPRPCQIAVYEASMTLL
jgi:hypothetical protein